MLTSIITLIAFFCFLNETGIFSGIFSSDYSIPGGWPEFRDFPRDTWQVSKINKNKKKNNLKYCIYKK